MAGEPLLDTGELVSRLERIQHQHFAFTGYFETEFGREGPQVYRHDIGWRVAEK